MKPTFQGEVQLAGWSESHNGGCKVTFWLQSPEDLDAFRVMTVRKGNSSGQRLACVLVEIGDDEQPVQPAPEKPVGGPLARLAGQWCGMPEFHQWLRLDGWDTRNNDEAATIVRAVCHIESRAELDHNTEAAEIFKKKFREPFMRHLEQHK